MPAHAHAPLAQHDVEQLHGRVLDAVGREDADAAGLVVLVKRGVGEVGEGALVVLGLEAQVALHKDGDLGPRPVQVLAQLAHMLLHQAELLAGLLAAREHVDSHDRHVSPVPLERHQRVIAPGPARRGVDHDVDVVVEQRGHGVQGKKGVDVLGAEALLQAVEGQAAELRFDEVWVARELLCCACMHRQERIMHWLTWPVLHNGLQLHVLVTALPPRHQVQHVHAVGRLAVLLALVARQLHLEHAEHRQARRLVAEPDEARVEVDALAESRDADQGRRAHDHEGGDGLVEEAGVHVCSFFQDDDVAPGALGGFRLCVCVCT